MVFPAIGEFMKSDINPAPAGSDPRPGALGEVRRQPWSFVVLALGAGLAAGLALRSRLFRKMLVFYFVTSGVPRRRS